MKKFLAALLLTASLVVLGASLVSADEVNGRKIRDTIVLVNDVEPDTLDPRRGNSIGNSLAMRLVYDALVDLDTENNVIPRLATSWEFIDDTHLKMNLRRDVKFSNGEPFTAEDVLFSFARTKEDSTSISTMSWYDEKESKALDDHTLIIAMHHPYAPVFYVLTGGRTWIGSKKTMEKVGEAAYARMPIGTGPYKIATWTSGAQIHYVRNDLHWGSKAVTPNVILKFVQEPQNRVIELETGASDFAYYISGSDIARVNSIDGYHIYQQPSERYFLVTMSMQHPLFQDKRVRYALSEAIDIEALADAGFDGSGTPMTGVYPSMIEHWKDLGMLKYDPDHAKALLKEAGLENGFEVELHVQPGAQFKKLAEIIQSYWAAIGVTAHVEQSALATREAQGPWQAAIRHANASEISNILIIYEKAFASRLAPNDDWLDGKLQELKWIYDQDKRRALLSELQDYIRDIRFSIPFAQEDSIFGMNDKIEGFKKPRIVSSCNISEWYIYE